MSVTLNTAPAPEAPKVRCDVRKALQESGLKHREFANALDISLTHLYEMLRGKYIPSPQLFAKICLLVNRQPSDLVYLDTGAEK